MTITQRIDQHRDRIAQSGNLTLNEATEIMTELSALFGNVTEEIREAERIYLNKLASIMNEPDMTVAKAKILAQVSDEYQRYVKAKNYKEFTLEIIRALKYRCKALEEEKSLSNY